MLATRSFEAITPRYRHEGVAPEGARSAIRSGRSAPPEPPPTHGQPQPLDATRPRLDRPRRRERSFRVDGEPVDPLAGERRERDALFPARLPGASELEA